MALKITKNQGSIQVTADKSGFYPFDGTITFPTNSLFTCAQKNTDMITFKSTSNGDVQFVGNYKDITVSGRSYDTKQKFLTAFSNLANQGASVDAYTKAETDAKLDAKQGKLKAGNGITLTEDATDGTTVVTTKLIMNNGPYNSDGIRIGRASVLGTSSGIAFGDESESHGGGIAIGNKARSRGESIVIGRNSSDNDGSSTLDSGVVIGNGAHGGGAGVVIGNGAHGGGAGVVIGNSCTVDGYGYAIGDNINIGKATKMTPIAIGYGAVADETQPLAMTILKQEQSSGGTPQYTPLNFIQGDANGKISLLKGDGTDERMVIQDEIEALKNAGGGGGTVDAYTKAETDTKLDAKQDKLTAGTGITITKDETAGTSTIATAVSLKDNGNGHYTVGNSIEMGDGIAIGTSATSPSAKSIAIGNSANINTDDIESVAVGYKANAAESYSVAIGSNARATKAYGVGVGYKCASDNNSVAIGKSCYALGGSAVAIGDSANANSIAGDSIAIGKSSAASSMMSIAIGAYASAENGSFSIAIGGNAKTTDMDSIAIGNYTKSTDTGEVVIGKNSSASGEKTVALGHTATATAVNPLVINAGYKTVDGVNQPLTVLQSDSTGKLSILKGDGTDERIVIQDALSAGGSGGGSTNPLINVKGTGRATISNQVDDGVAIGSSASVTKTHGVAVGHQSATNGDNGVAIGYMSKSTGSSAVAIGYGIEASNTNSVAIGYVASATYKYTVAIGSGAKATNDYGIAIGSSAHATGINGVGIGNNSWATADKPLVIKAGADVNSEALPMIQGDSKGKISIPLGDGTTSTMCLQDEIAALKAEIAKLKGGA